MSMEEGYSDYSSSTTLTHHDARVPLRRCLCGCGYTFRPVGRQSYFTAAHKQRDYRSRRNAKIWAWRYVMDELDGDLVQYPEVYQRYLLFYREGK